MRKRVLVDCACDLLGNRRANGISWRRCYTHTHRRRKNWRTMCLFAILHDSCMTLNQLSTSRTISNSRYINIYTYYLHAVRQTGKEEYHVTYRPHCVERKEIGHQVSRPRSKDILSCHFPWRHVLPANWNNPPTGRESLLHHLHHLLHHHLQGPTVVVRLAPNRGSPAAGGPQRAARCSWLTAAHTTHHRPHRPHGRGLYQQATWPCGWHRM